MKTKLNWKKKWCDDKSGCWYSAKVPIINWEYVIDVGGTYDYENGEYVEYFEYEPRIFYSKLDDDCTHITKKEYYKRLDAAQAACERHLKTNAEKFAKWLNDNDVDLISDQELQNLVDKSKHSVKLKK